MNADRLLTYYEKIAEAPDTIARLRCFILELAVRGKLVPQDQKDEPASELLKRMAQEKARRLIKDLKPSTSLHDAEPPYSLPKSWEWARLYDIGKLAGGMTPSMSRSEFWSGDIVWLSPKDIKSDEVSDSEMKITAQGLSETRLELYPKGSLFMVARSGILKRKFPVSINRVPATANQDMKVLTPFVGGQERYLQIMFRGLTEFILKHLVKTGTTVQSLKYEEFEQQRFPIPPLAEQQRIVAKVDELMALCDRLEIARADQEAARDRLATSSLARLDSPDPETFPDDALFVINELAAITARPDQLKGLRQTILNLAVRGKLVRQDQEDEPASVLLKRIEHEIAVYSDKHSISIKSPQPISVAQAPFVVPIGWEWTRLCALCNVITDGDHQPPPKADTGVAFLTIGNITTGKLDFNECRLVSRSYYESLAQYRTPKLGDILYTVVGATFGRPALVDSNREFCVQRHIAIIKPAPALNTRFLLLLLQSPQIYEQAARATTGAAQPTIPLRPLRNFATPLPPLPEQHRIVVKVDELMEICDQLEASLAVGQRTQARLLEALLQEALNSAGDAAVPVQTAA